MIVPLSGEICLHKWTETHTRKRESGPPISRSSSQPIAPNTLPRGHVRVPTLRTQQIMTQRETPYSTRPAAWAGLACRLTPFRLQIFGSAGLPSTFFFFSHRTAWYGWKFNTRTRTQANAHIHRRKRIQTYLRTCVRSCIQLYVSLKAWKYETHIHMQPLSALPSSIQ